MKLARDKLCRVRIMYKLYLIFLVSSTVTATTLLVARPDWESPTTVYRGFPCTVLYKGPGSSYELELFVSGAALNIVFWAIPAWIALEMRSEKRRRLREERARAGECLQCGYRLTGITSPRCPECGHPVREGEKKERS